MTLRFRLCFMVVVVLVFTLYHNTHISTGNLPGTWSERNVLADTSAMNEFSRSCSAGWRELIRVWEQQQLLAISGDKSISLVVYQCREICGGLGDRQRGILTSFLLALVTSRAFFIDSEHPVPLRHYFHFANPELDWVFSEDLLSNRTVFEESFMDSYPQIGDYATANLSFYNAYDVIVQKNNFWKPLSVLQNPIFRDRYAAVPKQEHVLAGCFLNYLLAPARHVILQVQRAILQQEAADKHILAVQVRSGDNQVKNDTVLDDLAAAFLKCIGQVSSASQVEFTVFLTTDSDQVSQRFLTAFPDLITFAGPILHLDGFFGVSDAPDAAFQKVLLDHIMLSAARELIISRSGFAEFASLRGFKAYRYPQHCGRLVRYGFPKDLPAGVPAGQLNSVHDILKPSFEGREKL